MTDLKTLYKDQANQFLVYYNNEKYVRNLKKKELEDMLVLVKHKKYSIYKSEKEMSRLKKNAERFLRKSRTIETTVRTWNKKNLGKVFDSMEMRK